MTENSPINRESERVSPAMISIEATARTAGHDVRTRLSVPHFAHPQVALHDARSTSSASVPPAGDHQRRFRQRPRSERQSEPIATHLRSKGSRRWMTTAAAMLVTALGVGIWQSMSRSEHTTTVGVRAEDANPSPGERSIPPDGTIEATSISVDQTAAGVEFEIGTSQPLKIKNATLLHSDLGWYGYYEVSGDDAQRAMDEFESHYRGTIASSAADEQTAQVWAPLTTAASDNDEEASERFSVARHNNPGGTLTDHLSGVGSVKPGSNEALAVLAAAGPLVSEVRPINVESPAPSRTLTEANRRLSLIDVEDATSTIGLVTEVMSAEPGRGADPGQAEVLGQQVDAVFYVRPISYEVVMDESVGRERATPTANSAFTASIISPIGTSVVVVVSVDGPDAATARRSAQQLLSALRITPGE